LEETVTFANGYKVVNKGINPGYGTSYVIYTNNIPYDSMTWSSDNFTIWGDNAYMPPVYTNDAPYWHPVAIWNGKGDHIPDTEISPSPYYWYFYLGAKLKLQTNIVDRVVMESVYANQIHSLKNNILDVTVADGNDLSDAEVKSIVKALRDTLNSF